ncbi:unnamed protein product [Calypogeia fissa]
MGRTGKVGKRNPRFSARKAGIPGSRRKLGQPRARKRYNSEARQRFQHDGYFRGALRHPDRLPDLGVRLVPHRGSHSSVDPQLKNHRSRQIKVKSINRSPHSSDEQMGIMRRVLILIS